MRVGEGGGEGDVISVEVEDSAGDDVPEAERRGLEGMDMANPSMMFAASTSSMEEEQAGFGGRTDEELGLR